MQAKGIIPHVDFIQAVDDLKADFLAMMELNLRMGDLPDSTQRKIRRVLEEAALYVTGKSAQTVLNFGDGKEPKALESGRKKVTA